MLLECERVANFIDNYLKFMLFPTDPKLSTIWRRNVCVPRAILSDKRFCGLTYFLLSFHLYETLIATSTIPYIELSKFLDSDGFA